MVVAEDVSEGEFGVGEFREGEAKKSFGHDWVKDVMIAGESNSLFII